MSWFEFFFNHILIIVFGMFFTVVLLMLHMIIHPSSKHRWVKGEHKILKGDNEDELK